jgi:hypothetical protein
VALLEAAEAALAIIEEMAVVVLVGPRRYRGRLLKWA